MADSQPANPLQLGQVLYEVQDITVVATPHGSSAASYTRVVFDANGGKPAESVQLGALAGVLDVRSCADMHTGTRNVFVLTDSSVQVLASGASSKTWPVGGLQLIVDLNPHEINAPHLLLLGRDGTGVYVQDLDCSTGALAPPSRLPSVAGTPVGAVLLRSQLEARLVVASLSTGGLVVTDLGSGPLGATNGDMPVASIQVGPAADGATVSLTSASLVADTSDQQLVLAYPDPNGVLQVVALGWTSGGLGVLARVQPDTRFAAPERPVFRVASGDLLDSGNDQIVVGYSGAYKGSNGCAALLLIELDESGKSPELTTLSHYAASNAGGQPLASIDLHVAVGLFGEPLGVDTTSTSSSSGVLGVVVVGAGATLGQLMQGEASVMTGLVTVDPSTKAFPPLGQAPSVPTPLSSVLTIDADAPGVFALPSDVTGQSVILGPPTLSQSLGKGQLLAVIQAPPFEAGVSTQKPTLTFSQSDSKMNGYNVNTNKLWMFSEDTGLNLGVGGQTLGRNVNKSYGHGFDKLTDHSTTTMVQTTSTITENDLLVISAMSYYVWTYPVYRKSAQAASDGTMAVIFPMTPMPVQTILPASDSSIGYKPAWQCGVLLSYVDLPHDGYDMSKLLFNLNSFPISDDSGGSTVMYDQTQMVTENTTKTFMVHNSTSDSAHFSFSKTLFDFVPVNFGLNLSESNTYSDNKVETTMLSHTTTMSITITSGAVNDIGYEYQLMPYIYQHSTMGCLMVTYDVTLKGGRWKNHYPVPTIMLPSIYPNSHDPVLAGYSRAISFQDPVAGLVPVAVQLFNNSLQTATDVVCEFYQGAPTVSGGKLVPSGHLIGTQEIPTLQPKGRKTVTLPMNLKDGDEVVVKVYVKPLDILGQVYWGIYPPQAYSQWFQLTETGAVSQRPEVS
jgi:hypothetical protein